MTTPLIAATDGSCLGNPGPAGWSWYVDEGRWAAGGFAHATNNIGELTAVQQLLLAVPGDVSLEIRADSQYVIDCLAGRNGKPAWIIGWRRKNWKTSAGAPVKNAELIEHIYNLLTARSAPVKFVHVRAHQVSGGDPWNEAADRLALAASKATQAQRPVSAGPGYSG